MLCRAGVGLARKNAPPLPFPPSTRAHQSAAGHLYTRPLPALQVIALRARSSPHPGTKPDPALLQVAAALEEGAAAPGAAGAIPVHPCALLSCLQADLEQARMPQFHSPARAAALLAAIVSALAAEPALLQRAGPWGGDRTPSAAAHAVAIAVAQRAAAGAPDWALGPPAAAQLALCQLAVEGGQLQAATA